MQSKLGGILFLSCCIPAQADIGTVPVASGFNRPVWAGMPRGTANRLWIMEQAGKVRIVDLDSGKTLERPFLDIEKDVSRQGNEEGLLGLAFSPDFINTGRYYVNFTDKEHFTRIVRFTSTDRSGTDPSSGETILKFKQPYQNHNGGWISFGPDGMLYIGNGDGGSANDPHNAGQSLNTLLGKILRIDVSGPSGYSIPDDNPFLKTQDAKPEIWAYGVRNPWRCSFDRSTGDFWVADVGQNQWEEINMVPAGKATGANYGWRLREGSVATPAANVGGDAPRSAIEPIYVYPHGGGDREGFSVTGGFVYRGAIRELQGRYLFADYQNGRIWSFRPDAGKAVDFTDHTTALQPKSGKIQHISSFAETNTGEILIVDHSGSIHRIVSQ